MDVHLCFGFMKQFLPFLRDFFDGNMYVYSFRSFVEAEDSEDQNNGDDSAKADKSPHVQNFGWNMDFVSVVYNQKRLIRKWSVLRHKDLFKSGTKTGYTGQNVIFQ